MPFFRDFTVKIASHAPRGTLEKLETLVGLALGKGWGAANVTEEVDICLRLLAASSQRSLTVIDVGANVGDWSLAMLEAAPTGTRIVAFEPNIDAVGQARRRLSAWDQVELVVSAVGPSQSTGRLVVPEDRSSHGVVLTGEEPASGPEIQVQVTSLDASTRYWSHGGVDIIKIDVEGGEWGVLQGALQTLKATKVVQFEFGEHSLDRRVLFRDFWDFFTSRGFRLWIQTPRGPSLMNHYSVRWESSTCTNFFAQRVSLVSSVGASLECS